MHSSQGVEQGVPGGVVAPITQVNAPHEGDEAPLQGLIAHVGIGCRLGTAGRAVVTRAAPPHLLQLVFGPGTSARSSPGTACNTQLPDQGAGRGGGLKSGRGHGLKDVFGPGTPAAFSPGTTCNIFSFQMNVWGCGEGEVGVRSGEGGLL